MQDGQTVRFDMCEMEYRGGAVESELSPIPFEEKYHKQYRSLIDESFYRMRKALNIRPYERYCDGLDALMKQKDRIFLLWDGDEIIGTVSCLENEIENVAVNANHRRQGYGRKLVEFALCHMQRRGDSPIRLSVAKWNEGAIALYESLGFVITRQTTVEGISAKDADGNWMFHFTSTDGLSVR